MVFLGFSMWRHLSHWRTLVPSFNYPPRNNDEAILHQTVFKKLLAVLSGHSSYWPTLNVVVTTTVNPTCARLISGIYNTARLMGGQ